MGLSLKYVLLGMLIERPGYGYDLQARIDERLPLLRYTPGAVYPALDRLNDQELIRAIGTKASLSTVRGSPRVTYAATEEGVQQFDRWMQAATPLEANRDELLAKLALARTQDLPRLLELTRHREAQLREELGDLAEIPAPAWNGSGRVPLALIGASLVRAADASRLSAAIESLQKISAALEHEMQGAPPTRAATAAFVARA